MFNKIPGMLMLLTSAIMHGQSIQEPGREAIEKVVREYIVRHPELLVESIQQYQEQQRAAEKERSKEVVVSKLKELEQDASSPAVGDTGGLTVVEFFDYRCGYCKKSASAISKLIQDHPGVRLVFKEFPLLGADSILAAKAALAANRQGAYLKFHQALMAQSNPVTGETIEQLAKEQGLDLAELKKDMDSSEVVATIERNRRLAEQLGITGTPTFVVDAELVKGAVDTASIETLIAQANLNHKLLKQP